MTLIELLVSIAIVGVLLTLLLPTIQSARESARQLQCRNNLKQIGLAWMNHESAYRIFPTGGRFNHLPDFVSAGVPRTAGSGDRKQRASWAYQILPFLEHEAAWKGSDAQTTIDCSFAAASTVVNSYSCPSRGVRIIDALWFDGTTYSAFQSDYAANAGTGSSGLPDGFVFECRDGVVQTMLDPQASTDPNYPPAKFSPKDVRVSFISDGLTNTLMVAEKRLSLPYLEGVDDYEGYTLGFDINSVRWVYGVPQQDSKQTNYPLMTLFGSCHPGTLNALFCDGSVRGIRISIDGTVWKASGSIAGGEVSTIE